MEITPSPFTEYIGIIRGRNSGYSFGGSSVHVAQIMGDLLQSIDSKTNVINDDEVMSRSCRALQCRVCLQVEVPVFSSDSSVYNLHRY